MPSAHLGLREAEVVKLVLEFLNNRELHITQLSLERETGVINGIYSDDMLFLRQLILDGQWDDVLEFIQPLDGIEGFDARHFRYVVYRHKYEELLCIKSEVGSVQAVDAAVEEVVKCLNEMEKCAPSRDEYSALCLLLTLPRLSDHAEYKNWNPSSARVNCFRTVYPLVEKYLPVGNTTGSQHGNGIRQFTIAKNDRLVQLIIKGMIYESCVEFCQQKATTTGGSSSGASVGRNRDVSNETVRYAGLLEGSGGFTDADLSLPSWLQSIPPDIFACPFEQRTLNVDIERLEKPCLEASWTEHMLVTPIKPLKTFPHSAMPSGRPRSAADIMSRSLNPQLDGLPFGLASQRHLMALSVGDLSTMSKSFAGFHLTGKKSMNTSVDRLFEEPEVFTSSSYGDLPAGVVGGSHIRTSAKQLLPKRPSTTAAVELTTTSTPNGKTRRDSIPEVAFASNSKKEEEQKPEKVVERGRSPATSVVPKSQATVDSPELYKEYQRQKLKIQEELANQEKKREEYLKKLMEIEANEQMVDNRIHEESQMGSKTGSSEALRTNRLSSIGINDPLSASTPKMPPTATSNNNNKATPNNTGRPVVARSLEPTLKQMAPLTPSQRGVASQGCGLGVTSGYDDPSLHVSQLDTTPSNSSHLGATSSVGTPCVQLRAKHGMVGPTTTKTTTVTTTTSSNASNGNSNSQLGPKPKFIPVTSLEDVQAIRAAEFHPNGKLYAIGSNSKTLRVCAYPKMTDLREDHETYQPTVLFKRTRHHKGSIYCLAWNATGDLLATGSNDKTVRLMKFNSETCNVEGEDIELTMHDGTVRDMCFIEDLSNKSSLLISGGAGDCKIYVTDCVTGTPFQALSGHSGHILSLYTWGGAMFVSSSQDRTIRFWDLRTRGCVNLIPSPPSGTGAVKGSPVATVAVDPSGRMLVSGQEDASCMLYDIRGNRIIQCFKPHTSDIRTIRFSPKAYYLLSGSYDNKVVLTDLQGDLTLPLPSLVVSEHKDKVIQCRWHPTEFAYLSTSADKTATLWGLPPN